MSKQVYVQMDKLIKAKQMIEVQFPNKSIKVENGSTSPSNPTIKATITELEVQVPWVHTMDNKIDLSASVGHLIQEMRRQMTSESKQNMPVNFSIPIESDKYTNDFIFNIGLQVFKQALLTDKDTITFRIEKGE